MPAQPGSVTFCRRSQELSATFQGLLDDCTSVNELGELVVDDLLCQPEEVELILDTMSANSFNFVAGDLAAGSHMVEVQAKIELDSSATEDGSGSSAESRACIGKGSVTVEEIRFVRNEDFEL